MSKPPAAPVMTRSPLGFLLTGGQQVFALVAMGLYFQYFVYRTERLLDSYLNHNTFLEQLRESLGPSPELRPRYIIFNPMTDQGQGMGNTMNGLLAAHMLGLEFNRTVCVSKDWRDFQDAFHSLKQEDCDSVVVPSGRESKNHFSIINYAPPPNECRLQSKLASPEEVVSMVGNTYPRWSVTPPGLWDAHYEPTEALIATLPYNKRPTTVVHLRQADDDNDHRSGLDEATLNALGVTLPRDTFLVTNNVEWYRYFDAFGWKNPGWHKVKHSALEGIEWGVVADDYVSPGAAAATKDDDGNSMMQLWSDWYTILKADHVYHTHSDFSLSAIHWIEIDSKTIQGTTEDGALAFTEEAWRVDEPMLRVVDRIGDQLNNCDKMNDDMFAGMMMNDDREGIIDDAVEHMDDVVGKDKFLVPGNYNGQKAFEGLHALDEKPHPRAMKEFKVPDGVFHKVKPEDWIDDAVANAMDHGILMEEDND